MKITNYGWSTRGSKWGYLMGRLRLPLYLALFVALALMPATALAAPPGHEHFRDIGSDVDPDFCGTGQAIDISFDVRVNIWLSAEGAEELVRTTFSGKQVSPTPTPVTRSTCPPPE